MTWLGRRVSPRGVLAGLFVLSLPFVNPYVRGDGNGYYAYLPSTVIDGDLDFENQFRRGDRLFRELYFDETGALRPSMQSPTGHVVNQWAVGPALLWLPFFLAAHLLVGLMSLLSEAVSADGYAAPYRWFCAVGTALYGWLAVALGYAVAKRVVGARAALAGALVIWWGSSLPVYMYFLPFHVHALAAFSVALFLWYWLRAEPFGWSLGRWAAWGAMAGLMIAVYYLNAIVALVALVQLARRVVEQGGPRGERRLAVAGAFAAGLVVALMPHFAIKTLLHGSPWLTGYRDTFFWTTPRLWEVGFSAEHGLFSWTPVVLVALGGLVHLARRDSGRFGTLLVVFAVFYYAVAAFQNWHGQSSFGNRFFVSLTLVFVVGAAAVVERLDARAARRRLVAPVVRAVAALLVVWNAGFIFQWGTDIVPNRGPVEFATVLRNQVQVVPARVGRFAWRYLVDRAGVAAEVEQRDAVERERYELKR